MEASIVVPEPFQHHFSSYHGPRRGFLDLPPELRDIIYDLTLTVRDTKDHDRGAQASILMTKQSSCQNLYLRQTPVFKADAPTYDGLYGRHLRYQPVEIAVAILRVNKQIHYEAARFFYGKNGFVVPIGLDSRKWYYRSERTPGIIDNFMNLPHHYLRMVQKCELRIQLPYAKHKWSKHFYLEAKERLTYFADVMHGREHSLKKLSIILVGWPQGQNAHPREVPSLQNVLEPLGTVHGIPEVTIVGVESEFMVKLKSALNGEKITCSPAQETYGTRNVKVRGRKRLQKYKLGRYYDSKYDWTTDCPVTSNLIGAKDLGQIRRRRWFL